MEILVKSVGRRKEAVAQVQITRGTGQFIINNKPAQDYLQNDACSLLSVKAPFEILRVSTETISGQAASLGGSKSVPLHPNGGLSDLPLLNATVSHKEEQEAGTEAIEKAATSGNNNERPTYGETENSLNALNIDTIVKVKGGGLMGQTEAIRLGIARAICLLSSGNQLSAEKGLSILSSSGQAANLGGNKTVSLTQSAIEPAISTEASEPVATFLDVRKQLKDKGYLTQDSRVKERRKYGLKKARKASQYHKR